MSTEELKAKVRRVCEDGWNKGNLAAFDENYAPNVAFHHPTNPQEDREGVEKYLTAVRASYPDMHFTVDDLTAAEGERVVACWTWEGTDTRGSVAFGTPPTGKHATFTGITVSRFEGGRAVEV